METNNQSPSFLTRIVDWYKSRKTSMKVLIWAVVVITIIQIMNPSAMRSSRARGSNNSSDMGTCCSCNGNGKAKNAMGTCMVCGGSGRLSTSSTFYRANCQ